MEILPSLAASLDGRLPLLVNAPRGAFTVGGEADLTRRRGEREEFEGIASLVAA